MHESDCPYRMQGAKIRETGQARGPVVRYQDYCGALWKLEGLRALPESVVVIVDQHDPTIRRPCRQCVHSGSGSSCDLNAAMGGRIRTDDASYHSSRLDAVAVAYEMFGPEKVDINDRWVKQATQNGVEAWPQISSPVIHSRVPYQKPHDLPAEEIISEELSETTQTVLDAAWLSKLDPDELFDTLEELHSINQDTSADSLTKVRHNPGWLQLRPQPEEPLVVYSGLAHDSLRGLARLLPPTNPIIQELSEAGFELLLKPTPDPDAYKLVINQLLNYYVHLDIPQKQTAAIENMTIGDLSRGMLPLNLHNHIDSREATIHIVDALAYKENDLRRTHSTIRIKKNVFGGYLDDHRKYHEAQRARAKGVIPDLSPTIRQEAAVILWEDAMSYENELKRIPPDDAQGKIDLDRRCAKQLKSRAKQGSYLDDMVMILRGMVDQRDLGNLLAKHDFRHHNPSHG